MGKATHPTPRRRQRGAVAVAFILFAVLLLAFMGFATDVGRLYVSKSELQNASDACALAAAGALTGANPNQLEIAEDFGITTGTRNLMGMQDTPVTINSNNQITFSATLNGAYKTRSEISPSEVQNMRYARCTLSETVSTLVLQVANALPGQSIPSVTTIRATAVASLEPSISNCAIPLAICAKTEPGTETLKDPPDFGYARGEWLIGRFDTQNNKNGKFAWVDFPGYDQTRDLAKLIAGGGLCNLSSVATLTPTQGAVNSLADTWNWRFGVKKASGPPRDVTPPYPPDLSGYAYAPDGANWPSMANAFDDFKAKRGANTPWNGIPDLGGSWSASSADEHAAGTDRRLVVGPFVDCTDWEKDKDRAVRNNTSQPIIGWACYLMLNPVKNPTQDDMGLEYRGPADAPSSGCVTSGAPGGPTAGGPKVPALVQ